MILVRQGDAGNIVGQIQQSLVEAGSSIDVIELKDQKFGPTTLTAVIAFQAHHVGSDGHALSSDGVVGPETFYALQHPAHDNRSCIAQGWRCSPSEARSEIISVLQWAVDMIGTTEDPPGSNRSKEIDEWTNMIGVDKAQAGPPWCAFFASAAYRRCTAGSPFGTIAASWKIAKWGLDHGKIVTPDQPLAPGDIAVILRGDLSTEPHGHTIIIAGPSDNPDNACSVEGNSSNAVRGLIRPRSTFSYVVRPLT